MESSLRGGQGRVILSELGIFGGQCWMLVGSRLVGVPREGHGRVRVILNAMSPSRAQVSRNVER